MKGKQTTYYCMDCDWEETSHRLLDGIRCPNCGGPVLSKEVEKKK